MENIEKRLQDLSFLADRKGIVTFSNFLNIDERNTYHQMKNQLITESRTSGGYAYAERQMIAFIPDALYYDWQFPICCLLFEPLHPKYAEELTHRDVLGALMNLGIDRSRIGDIRLDGQNYYIFCEETIAPYLLESLTQIRHTMVHGRQTDIDGLHLEQKYEVLDGTVASVRLDNLISFVTRKSRSQSVLLIQAQKVFVNERMTTSNACECKPGDILSVRGYGKYLFDKSTGETKKGRVRITMKKYC